ncbi:MAG: hypothetical protein HZB29_05030 [Nitrospinae bacterium]|nr:hypothetical protein [Nitrospinota bacterium]
MERENPPAYLSWLPGVFLAIILGIAFAASTVLMEPGSGAGLLDRLSTYEKDAGALFDDAEKAVREIVAFMEGTQGQPKEAPPRPALRPLGEPVALADFAIAEKKAGAPGVALLKVSMDKGVTSNDSASGMVTLSPPADSAGKQALEIMLKGEGLATIGVGVLQKGGAGSYRWDWPDAPVSEKWTTAQLRFSDAVLWEYDAQSKRYRKVREWKEPDKIGQIRFYVKPRHMTRGNSAKLWIGTVSAR